MSAYIHQENETATVVMRPVYATYVPLTESLKAALSIPGTLGTILSYMDDLREDNSYLSNVIQGDLWLKKYSNSSKIIIPLQLFFDEFETRNPLGSHAGEEKLGAVYISIACLPPYSSAKLRNIFLSTIINSKHLKQFGNEKVFEKIISDLNFLSENGIPMEVNGEMKIVYFQLLQILGDNLGQNLICGFTECFKSKRFCRVCSASNKQCQEMTEENQRRMRFQ